MAQDDQAPESSDVAEFIAPAWERYRERLFEGQRAVSDWLVEHIDPRPGQTILELAAGPGETGFLVAERVGPNGQLLSTDVSPGMVDAARRGAEARGLDNVEFRVMDARQIELADASVDGVISRFGVMLVPEQDRVVGEVRRVLRDGGRLAYGVWGSPERNPWLTLLVGAVLQCGHAPPGDPFAPGGVFSLAVPQANRELLDAGGFSDVRVEEIESVFRFDSFDDYWDLQTSVSGQVAILIGPLPADEVEAIKKVLEPTLAPFRSDHGYEFPSLAIGVSAR